MSFEEWLQRDVLAKVAGWAAATGDVRRYAYFTNLYPLLDRMREMCKAAGLRCDVAVHINYSEGHEPFAVKVATGELPELQADTRAKSTEVWRTQIAPIANRALLRCRRAGIECRIEFPTLGKIGSSGHLDNLAIARIEGRLSKSLDRSLGRKKWRSQS
jgi:hypothetical protein